MRRVRRVSRRSFLATVAGGAALSGALLAVSDEARAQSGCSDTDPISNGGDPGGNGRNCRNRPHTGCSDSDPSDPAGTGRRCNPREGCNDRDPSDPVNRGRSCGNVRDNGAYVTGRSERRYEVCWVDSPNRAQGDCNWQTYSEWRITWSDGRVEFDTAEAMRRRAEMEQRGYVSRGYRMLQDW